MMKPAVRRPRRTLRPTPASSAAVAALVIAGLLAVGAPSAALAEAPARVAASAAAAAAAQTPEPAVNPALTDACGVDVAFVLDVSKSIGADGIADLEDATDAFTAALVDTGSQVSITSFNQDATVRLEATDLTTATLPSVQASYAGLGYTGYTNWKRGLEVAAGTFGGFADGRVELTIVISDGGPNTVDPTKPNEFDDGSIGAVAPSIVQANAIKATGSHVFAIGVGPEITAGPIQAISGPTLFTGDNLATADYATSTDYSTLADDLGALARALCGGTVTVHKEIDGAPVADWSFSTADADVAPASQATDATGATAPFAVGGFTGATRTVEFTEEDRPFHTLDSVTCHDADGAPVASEVTGPLSWEVVVAIDAIVHCDVVNDRAPTEWTVTKSSDPPSGATVAVGDQIAYTLTVTHVSGPAATDLSIRDDISQLAPFVEFDGFVGSPPKESSWNGVEDGRLLLRLASLDPGQTLEVTYLVTVEADAPPGTVLRNHVLTNCSAEPGPGLVAAPADPCVTEHLLPGIRIEKAWEHDGGQVPVDSGDTPPDVITYTVRVWNDGSGPVQAPVVTDVLPAGTTFVPGSEVLPAGWQLDDSVPGEVAFTQVVPGAFGPIAHPGIAFSFDVEVGALAQADPTEPIADLVNDVCVVAELPAGSGGESGEAGDAGDAGADAEPGLRASAASDLDPDLLAIGLADCADAATPVKSVALAGAAQCVNDTPWFGYSVEPSNLTAPLPPVALIWWTADAYAGHDPSIDAADESAILADGASQVDYVEVPADWEPGDEITGRQLWPGAVLDAAGNPIDWPGWTLRPDGTWVLDPAAPFSDLREEAVVEIRVNPSTAVITAYPPPTPNCVAAPRQGASGPAGIASTGTDPAVPVLIGGLLALLGASVLAWRFRLRRRAD